MVLPLVSLLALMLALPWVYWSVFPSGSRWACRPLTLEAALGYESGLLSGC